MRKEIVMTARAVFQHGLTFGLGFLVRPCCVVPAVMAVLGLSGAGFAATIAPYRGWFLVLAAGFFGVSFYFNFLRNHNWAGMVVWALSALVAAGLLLGPALGQAAPDLPQPIEEYRLMATETTDIPVQGMACQACARRLEKVLSQTPGVATARVDFENKQAHLVHAPAQVDRPGLEERVREAGFAPHPASNGE